MISPSTTITPEGRRLRRILITLAGLVIVINLGALAWARLTASEVVRGPNGSTYVTDGNGAAGFAELLQRLGQPIERRRSPIGIGDLDPSTTFAILDAGWTGFGAAELEELTRFVSSGGRLVLTGPTHPDLMDSVLGHDLEWSPVGITESAPIAPTLGTPEITVVTSSGFGSFADPGPGLPLLGSAERVTAIVAQVGAGSVVALADGSLLANDHLGRADNSLLAVYVTNGRRVVFDEYRHGYGGQGLWASLPGGWRVTLWLLAATLLVALLAYGRRLGPPEATVKEFPPERVRYVEAIAGLLSRTNRPWQAVEPVRRAARHILVERTGSQNSSRLSDAAVRLGLTEDEADAILSEVDGEEAALRAASSLSKLVRAQRDLP